MRNAPEDMPLVEQQSYEEHAEASGVGYHRMPVYHAGEPHFITMDGENAE